MQLKSRSAVILILGIFWGVLGLSMITGAWQTKETAEEIVVNTPNDIKGWMTLNDVSEYFKLPVPELVKILGLPENVEADKPVKEIAGDLGKETDDFREVLAAYLGVEGDASDTLGGEVPASAKSGTDVPGESGAVNQTSDGKVPDNQEQPVAQPAEEKDSAPVPVKTEQPKETETSEGGNSTGSGTGSGSEEVIKGRMTLSEVEYVTKVPAGYICKELGIPEDADRGKALRDLGQEFGFEVDIVRDIVAKYKP